MLPVTFAPLDSLVASLGGTEHPMPGWLPGMTQVDIHLPNGRGLTVIHSPAHNCGEHSVEIGLITAAGAEPGEVWVLDDDPGRQSVLWDYGQRTGPVMGWVDVTTFAALLTRLSTLAPLT